MGKLARVGEALEDAERHARGGREAFEDYLRLIYATPASGGSEPEPRRVKAGWRSNRAHPRALEAIKRVGWPKNAEGKVSARGLLYDKHGNEIGDHSRPGGQRCDANTPHLIRRDQTLHVHAALENGGYFRKSYRGTGKAIA